MRVTIGLIRNRQEKMMDANNKYSRMPFPLRLETELSQWVKERAKAEDRSINAEINRLLRQIKEEREKTQRAA